MSVVVVGNGERADADAVAERIARQIWDERDNFVYHSASLAESVGAGGVAGTRRGQACAAARSRRQLHVGRQVRHDGSARGSLEAGPRRHRQRAVCDPQAVAALAASGVGSTVTLAIGNKLTSDALPAPSPLAVSRVVRALTDGEYVISGPTYTASAPTWDARRCSTRAP